MTPIEWLWDGDTGISSKAIFGVMNGLPTVEIWAGDNTPRDPGDFGRCYQLVALFPEYRDRLPEVAVKFPKWKSIVDASILRIY
jgi:hypothetical protein